MKKWQKVMEFCDQSWNFTNFSPEFDQTCPFFADIRKFCISLEFLSQHFPTFSAKYCERKICTESWSWKMNKRSWKSRGKIFFIVWEPWVGLQVHRFSTKVKDPTTPLMLRTFCNLTSFLSNGSDFRRQPGLKSENICHSHFFKIDSSLVTGNKVMC